MTHSALTAEQRAAIKTRADRVQEILRSVEELEAAKSAGGQIFIGNKHGASAFKTDGLARRIVTLGIDTLIAQLEQELTDLDVVGLTCEATGLTKPQVEQIVGAIESAKSGPWQYDAGTFRVPNEFYPPGNAESGVTAEVCHDPHRVMSTAEAAQ